MASHPVFQLIAGVQAYDWGKIGSDSKAAQYAQAIPGFDLDGSTPYAELWMGTHPSCPSRLLSNGKLLADHLAIHPELLGQSVIDRFGNDLPFLFKILSIRKALSIQAHPDKALAEKLHAERPDIYKDGNHKPEMAIAITPFSGLCGFLPPDCIATYLDVVPEFALLIPSAVRSSFKATLIHQSRSTVIPDQNILKSAIRDVFTAVMQSSSETVERQLRALIERYKSSQFKHEESDIVDLIVELDRQFPGDVGVFCVFMMNVVKLGVGESIFLKADEPHAYISGDIVETMATSDNVVRAGLTPKLRDVPTLLSMLTYTYEPASKQTMSPVPFRATKHTKIYDPPIEEFSVLLTTLGAKESEVHGQINGPSILIITRGDGFIKYGTERIEVHMEGEVYFVGAGTWLEFTGGESGLVVYRAFVEA